MKYTQPYGVTDPNASYINGNPATGTMGSIPPAESVEHDQREIVALIAATGQTPVGSDLTQLLKAVKLADVHNYFKFGTNGGSASAWSMACPTFAVMPPPAGTTVWFKPGLPSVAGGTTFSVNGSVPAPVVYNDLVGVSVGDISNTAWLLMFFDGTHWLIIAGSSRQAGTIPLLTRATDWYVNGTTGDDTWDGSVPTHATATTGPFRTMQRAADEVVKYNQNGYNQTIHVADGVYANVKFKQTNGSGTVIVQGNDASTAKSLCSSPAGSRRVCVSRPTGGCGWQRRLRRHHHERRHKYASQHLVRLLYPVSYLCGEQRQYLACRRQLHHRKRRELRGASCRNRQRRYLS